MPILATILVGLVAALHAAIMALEMFYWQSSLGRRLSGMDGSAHEAATALAANQGLYNGFIAAGLIYGMLAAPGGFGIVAFFLCCVIVAGLYGAATVKPAIFLVQSVPAALALAAWWWAR